MFYRLLVLLCVAPLVADAATCTDGVDCYCDCVANPGQSGCSTKYPGITTDAALKGCHDWEHPNLRSSSTDAWYKAPGGQPGFRGGAGIWQTTYGPETNGCSWLNGQPASPTHGSTCTESVCAGAAEWRVDDLYQGNSKTCYDIQAQNEIDDEIAGLTLTGGTSGGGQVWDGIQHMAQRVRVGAVSDGAGSLSTSLTGDFGVTMARAYATNILTATAPRSNSEWLTTPWKGEQTTGGLQFPEGNTGGTANNPPFSGGTTGMTSLANCNSAVAAAEIRIGNVQCESGSNVFRIAAARVGDCTGSSTCNATNEFKRSRDWPLGTWGCVRSYWGGHKTANGELYIEFQGPNDSAPRRIFWVRNLNLNLIFGGSNIGTYRFDAYYNANETPSTYSLETFYRYFDNMHVRAGEPVSCQQIGFASGADVTIKAPFLLP